MKHCWEVTEVMKSLCHWAGVWSSVLSHILNDFSFA